MSQSQAPPNPIRSLAIVCNALPPYRVHFHQRIVREMPELKLWTVCTHEGADQAWKYAPPAEINPMQFGPGESVTRQGEAKRAWHEWKKGGRIIEWIRKEQIGAVVVNGYNDAGRLRILRWCARHDVPIMLFGDSNIRGDRARGVRTALKRRVLKRILGWCDAVLACGALGREYFLKYGAAAERISLTPYEPDYAAIEAISEEQMTAAARQFDLQRARRRMVFSGRFASVKRPDLLVDAFVALADERPDWDLVMIGSGQLAAELRGRIPERLRSRVVFTGFVGQQETISAVYRLSDVLVLPSDYEPWAVVVNEAAAAGLAIVCTDVVGAAAELVRDGINGWTFPAGNLAQLVRVLRDATAADRIDQLKSGSRQVLRDWRRVADPVDGLRKALHHCVIAGQVQ